MSKIEQLEREAEAFETSGDLHAALDRWRQMARLDLSRYHLVNQGRLALALGLLAEAENALQAAVERAPEHAEAYFRLGLLYRRKPDLEAALRSYRRGLALEERPSARLLLANTERALGMIAEARDNFEKVIALEPDNDEAWFGLGLTYPRADRERAISCFRKAIELDPKAAPQHRELGLCLWAERRYEEAEWSLLTALELEPSHPWTHDYLGHVHWAQGRIEEAEADFQRAIDLWPERAFYHCELAEFYERTGRTAEAETAFVAGLTAESNDPHANLKYGEFLLHQGKQAKAVTYLRRAAAAAPTDQRPRRILRELGLEAE